MLYLMQMSRAISAIGLGLALVGLFPHVGFAQVATALPDSSPTVPDSSPTVPDSTPTEAAPARPSLDLSVRGSPLIRGRSGSRAEVTLELGSRVDNLDLRVVSFGGSEVRQLAQGPRGAGTFSRIWDGRDDRGNPVSSGAYRIVATATSGDATSSVTEWATVADRKIYPRRPGFITIAVDPGHGGSLSGAVGKDGTREADLNLDIGLRLARMLEGAGVNVVITRTTDTRVNSPAIDLTGDGVVDDTDELAARPDIANLARADLFIAVHNNTAVNRSVGGPSTYFSDERPFTDRSTQLARIIQDSMVEHLARFESDAWTPFDHGSLIYPYYVLRGYDPPRLQRPTQMPGVLSEGLFLSNPTELGLLKQAAVRQAIAEGYYDAIATYLKRRTTQVGYASADGPLQSTSGEVLRYEVEVRNQGNEPMAGWDLSVGAVEAGFRYEGRGRAGQILGSKRIPRLEPGESATVTVTVEAPPEAGVWTLLFDARDKMDKRASRRGSPPLQLSLTTVDPEPTDPEPTDPEPTDP